MYIGDYAFISMNARWEGEKPDQRDESALAYVMAQKNLTLKVTLQTHKLLMQGRKTHGGDSVCAGQLRTYQYVKVGNKELVPPHEVESGIGKLFSNLDEILKIENDNGIFLFHILFLTIHPFCDGNGRVARMLAYWMENQKGCMCEWLHQRSKVHYNAIFKNEFMFLEYARKHGIC